MIRKIIFAGFLFLLISLPSEAQQRKGSQELGGAISFWSGSVSDSSLSQLDLVGIMSYYFNKDMLMEFEPRIGARIHQNQIDVNSHFLGNFSVRLIDMTNYDRYGGYTRDKQMARTTGSIFLSAGAGFWLDSADIEGEKKVYSGPSLAVGIGTHSRMGSLTLLRTKIQYIYNTAAGPEHEDPWGMLTMTMGFSIFTKL